MRFLFSRRWLLFFLAVAALAFACYRLGVWQFNRLEETRAANAVIEQNLQAEPIAVGQVLTVGQPPPEKAKWQRVRVRGEYDEAHSVVIRYKSHDGKPGVNVVTPLVTDSGAAVLVDRGFMVTDNRGLTDVDAPAAPSGTVTVVGWVRLNASADVSTVADGSARAVNSRQIAKTVPYPVYGGYVDALSQQPAPASPLAKPDGPELSEGRHFFYGIQWWFFAGLAMFGFGYLIYDERKKLKQRRAAEPEPDVPSEPGGPSESTADHQPSRQR